MAKNSQIQMFEAAMEQKLSQLARQYSDELVNQTWNEIRIAGDDEAFLKTCGWKTEMTLPEALDVCMTTAISLKL